MLMRSFISLLLVFAVLPVQADEARWNELPGFEKVWIKHGATFHGSETGEFNYDSLRFGREVPLYEYKFHDVDDLFQKAYKNDFSKGVLVDKKTGGARILAPSIAEAWLAVRDDPAVVAVIPMGFARVAGDSRVVGYRRVDGRDTQSVFFAPNLDAILCLNDVARRKARSYDGQVPFLFGLNLKGRPTYTYVDGANSINLADQSDPQRFLETFSACSDLLQLGRRIIEPRDYEPKGQPAGRIRFTSEESAEIQPTQRVVLLYDRFGHMNFVRTRQDTGLEELGRLLSSNGYYDDEPCKYREKQVYAGRSISCELWAVTIAAFDGAAIAIRQGDKAFFWGDPSRFTPGVLIIRRKEQAPAEPAKKPISLLNAVTKPSASQVPSSD
ncbi:hypothetical protein [Falsiruegeria mediterranea]|uniref:Phosphodiester glycosidase domain-containing protein n=1 Tax=Falsiruegeria mediterranea M17 TaxID=1200281 RepID=A0A2R8C8R3_9RHOB|nr:hypothetical protein [Falsiruegeria mediterranea]SPJ28830.1 hypothetical protein TRM7615_02338 [Falsiruegeria mediterranea M17]